MGGMCLLESYWSTPLPPDILGLPNARGHDGNDIDLMVASLRTTR